ncbi:MAG TPA: RtcB family protein [Anaerolineae bacterium]|nr:RtcB family protein [Anaerolineae bacterium]
MIALQDFIKISEFEWEIPQGLRSHMRASVKVFANRDIIEAGLRDSSFEQAINATTLPGLVGSVVIMPDVHQGYGFPIGGVAATDVSDGVISPGAIGYDINCGVRLLVSHIPLDAAAPYLKELTSAIYEACPSGVGKKGSIRLSRKELEQVCREGSKWALHEGLATREDTELTEDGGCLAGADPAKVSSRAKERGSPQVGSLGAGNHFIEIGVVDQITDLEAASIMGLEEGCLSLMIHSGSRGFGHQICTDYVREFQIAIHKYGIELPDRELVCAPLNSSDGQNYLAAMRCAANYAFCNRQVMAHFARQSFEKVFAGKERNYHLQMVYDLAHNMGKIENHEVDGKKLRACIHRKGATRAFGPYSPGIPDKYKKLGQPVLVPGSMGTSSWILLGTQASMHKSFGSACHGAGRVFSRKRARREVRGEQLLQRLESSGIHIMARSMRGLAEEAPEAYKDVDIVVKCVVGSGIARKVARLKPVAVIKG